MKQQLNKKNRVICDVHDAQNDMVEMTGNVAVNKRGDSWLSKRVFFLTPQVKKEDSESFIFGNFLLGQAVNLLKED